MSPLVQKGINGYIDKTEGNIKQRHPEKTKGRREISVPQVTKIELSDKAREVLEKLAKGHKTGQQMAKRAEIILLSSAENDTGLVSKEMSVSEKQSSIGEKDSST